MYTYIHLFKIHKPIYSKGFFLYRYPCSTGWSVSFIHGEGDSIWFYSSIGCMKLVWSFSFVVLTYFSMSETPTSRSFNPCDASYGLTEDSFTTPFPDCLIKIVLGDPRIEIPLGYRGYLGTCKLDRHLNYRFNWPLISLSPKVDGTSGPRKI